MGALEVPAEAAGARIAARVRRFLDARGRHQQPPFGVLHPDAAQVLQKCQARVFLEQPIQVRRRHVGVASRRRQADRRVRKLLFEKK